MLSIDVDVWDDFVVNTSFLLSFSFFCYFLKPWLSKLQYQWSRIMWGIVYGLASIAMIQVPLVSWEGVIIDSSAILIALSGGLGGAMRLIITLSLIGLYHWLDGGFQGTTGLGCMITSAFIGLIMYMVGGRKASTIHYACFGFLLSIGVLLWSFSLSERGGWYIVTYYTLPVCSLYIVSMVFIHKMIRAQDRKTLIEEQLFESEKQYRTLVEHSQDLIFNCDLEGKLISVNRKFIEVTGIDSNEIAYKSMDQLLSIRSELSQWKELLAQTIQTRLPVKVEKEIVNNEGISRIYVTTLSPVIGTDNQMKSVIGTCYDITSIRKSEQHILQLSYYDTLTELPNRKMLMEKLHQSILNSSGSMIALVLIDLDNFKFINDTRGYAFGDELLKAVGIQLQQLVSSQHTVAKMGEDEYAILLEELDQIQPLLNCIQMIQDQFQYPLFIRGEPIHTRISIGVALHPGDGETAEEVIRNAGTAIYKAKKSGKNQCCFYNADMRESLLRRSSLEDALRKALIHNEFILQFQPQCHADNAAVRGFEALIRWVHPELGTIAPAEFIPIAEETGVIVPIGEWVIRTACERIKAIQKYHFHNALISVNISAVQLKRPDFVEMVIGILNETQLDPRYLELEITETILMESFQNAIEVLETLRAFGIKIALDDFGTGYSSLSYLKRLPIETLKIDKSFIQDITKETAQQALTESIISLVHKMGIQVVAEGVETKEQLEYLQAWGCEYVQGFLLSKPLYELEIRKLSFLPQWSDPA